MKLKELAPGTRVTFTVTGLILPRQNNDMTRIQLDGNINPSGLRDTIEVKDIVVHMPEPAVGDILELGRYRYRIEAIIDDFWVTRHWVHGNEQWTVRPHAYHKSSFKDHTRIPKQGFAA